MIKNKTKITNRDISERIRIIRSQLNLTSKEMFERLGIKQSTWSNYERGKRDIPHEVVIKIANIFNINPHWLITGNGEIFLPSIEYKTQLIQLKEENELLKQRINDLFSSVDLLKIKSQLDELQQRLTILEKKIK